MTTRRAALYVRISDDREGAGLGVERQEKDCRELAARLGWEVVEVFVDNDLTAFSKSKRWKPRPAYERMKTDLQQGRLNAVITWHTDRLHRTPRELEDFIDVAEAAGVPVETNKSGVVDLSTPAGRAVARTLCAWAYYESEHKSERVRAKYVQIALAGEVGNGGHRPFGYAEDRRTVVEHEAVILRELYAKVLTGRSLRSLCHELTDRGVMTTRGGPWSVQGLRFNLLCGRNAGLREHKGVVVAPAVWPAVVDRQTWEQVRALLLDKSRLHKSRLTGELHDGQRKYLLTGLLRCAPCGGLLRPLRNHDNQAFGCRPTKDGGCGGVLINSGHTERHVTLAILARLREMDLVRQAPTDPTGGLLEQIAADERRLAELAEAFADDADASPLELRAAGARIRRRIEQTRAAIAAAARSQAVADPLSVVDAWEDYELGQRVVVARQLIERVDVSPAARRGQRFKPERLSIVWR